MKIGVCACHWKLGPAACSSKGNKEARVAERKVCFILVAGTCWRGRTGDCTKADHPPLTIRGLRAFKDRRRGLLETYGQPWQSSWSWSAVACSASPWLFQVQLISISRVTFHVPESWQLMTWLQSSHHVANLSTWWGVSAPIRQLTGHQFSSAAQLCPTLCDPMDCSTSRPPSPSPTPGPCSNSCPSSWSCHHRTWVRILDSPWGGTKGPWLCF